MLPGVDLTEMLLVAVIAMVVMGPRDLPLMMRKFGRFTGKMRAMAFEFKQGFDELGRQAELDELRKEVASLKQHTGLEDLSKDLREDQVNLDKDVRSALTAPEGATHPAAGTPTPAQTATPEPAPYAGLSAEHPGYDAGEDFRIDGPPPEPPAVEGPGPEPAAAPEASAADDGVHTVPDDEVRPPASMAKQDASA